MSKKVSVCVPVYNGAVYIEETLRSVLSQTYSNIELVVLDNKSTDSTYAVVEKLLSDQRIKLFTNSETLEMGDNWNACLSYATGEYKMLLSADDLLLPQFIEKAVAILDKENVDVFTANHLLFDSRHERKRKVLIKSGIYEKFTSLILLQNPFSINFSLFTAHAVQTLIDNGSGKFFKKYYTCDYDMWIRSSQLLKVYYTQEILGHYRLHENNLSKNKLKMIRETLLVLDSNKSLLLSKAFLIFWLTKLRLWTRRALVYIR